jgi:hypothetical protein
VKSEEAFMRDKVCAERLNRINAMKNSKNMIIERTKVITSLILESLDRKERRTTEKPWRNMISERKTNEG